MSKLSEYDPLLTMSALNMAIVSLHRITSSGDRLREMTARRLWNMQEDMKRMLKFSENTEQKKKVSSVLCSLCSIKLHKKPNQKSP